MSRHLFPSNTSTPSPLPHKKMAWSTTGGQGLSSGRWNHELFPNDGQPRRCPMPLLPLFIDAQWVSAASPGSLAHTQQGPPNIWPLALWWPARYCLGSWGVESYLSRCLLWSLPQEAHIEENVIQLSTQTHYLHCLESSQLIY